MTVQNMPNAVSIADIDPARESVFFDPLSYATYDHPYDVYRELRDLAPVYYNARRGLWVVSRYRDVRACLKNHEQMVNALGNDMDGTHDSYGTGNLVAQDQLRHSVLRTVVRPSFAAPQILAMEEHVRARARELLAELRSQGGGDFATEFAIPLGVRRFPSADGHCVGRVAVLGAAPDAIDAAHGRPVRCTAGCG